MVCRRSDFEGQPVGKAQNPMGQTFTPQTEGNRVQGWACYRSPYVRYPRQGKGNLPGTICGFDFANADEYFGYDDSSAQPRASHAPECFLTRCPLFGVQSRYIDTRL